MSYCLPKIPMAYSRERDEGHACPADTDEHITVAGHNARPHSGNAGAIDGATHRLISYAKHRSQP